MGQLANFDEFGAFEITDFALLRLVAGGVLGVNTDTAEPAARINAACGADDQNAFLANLNVSCETGGGGRSSVNAFCYS